MAAVKVGDRVPDFSTLDDSGRPVSLSDFKGKSVVLYFYPKDDTSGCTKEACDFRDAFPRFGKIDAEVVGVSPDSVESHVEFKKKYSLPFKLLADEGHKLADKFGVWKEKSMYGKKYMGIERTTFVIGADGKIGSIIEGIKADEHSAAALEAMKTR